MVTDILDEILGERVRQDALKARGRFRWTCADIGPCISHSDRLAVLAEEFGEVAREVCEGLKQPIDREHLREELIQTAAVCLAWIEGLDKELAK